MILVTTVFSEFWNDEKDTFLFLGPWCTRYDQRNKWQNRPRLILKNPWDNRDQLHRDAEYCEKAFDQILEELGGYLNAVHGTRYQLRYWRILIGPWLLYYIHSVYGRYVLIKNALEQYPSLRTKCLSENDFTVPHDMSHFSGLLQDDRYNLQLFSSICRAMGVPFSGHGCPYRTSDSSPLDSGRRTGKLADWCKATKGIAKRGLYALINFLCMLRRKPIVIADPVLSLAHRISWNLRFGARGATGLLYSWFKPEESVGPLFDKNREGLKGLKANDNFIKLMVGTFPLSLPTLYLEGYSKAREKALGGWNYTPRVCATSAAWYYNEKFKFLAAEWSEKNCRLVGIQHGGGYGTGRYFGSEWHERKISDRFFPWGWSYQDPDGRVKDLPAPSMAGTSNRPQSSPESFSRLLLVVTDFYLYPYRLDSLPQASQIEEYIEWRIRFINALRGEPREKLFLRRAPTEHGWCERERERDACGNIPYDDMSAPLADRLRHVRLAVFDHQTTAYLEALALNIPCILFWRPDHWEIRQEASSYFDALTACGILYDNPEKAAARVLEVYDDPTSWWQSESVQKARQRFVDRFALGRKDWVKCWVNALEEEMALSQVKES